MLPFCFFIVLVVIICNMYILYLVKYIGNIPSNAGTAVYFISLCVSVLMFLLPFH